MRLFWSLLFLLVPILGVATFVCAPYFNIVMPPDVSEHGRVIDHLFMFILWLTGLVFIGTECILFYFMWKYDAKENAERLRRVLGGETGVARDLVVLNAAVALVVAGKAAGMDEGITLAAHSIDSGAANARLDSLVEFGKRMAGSSSGDAR